jgi:hypothetical protein
LDENKGSVSEVAVFAKEFRVAAGLEIFPREFRILVLRRIRCKGVADLIGCKVLEEVSEVNRPAFGFAELPAF